MNRHKYGEYLRNCDAKSHKKVIIVMEMALLCNNIAIFWIDMSLKLSHGKYKV